MGSISLPGAEHFERSILDDCIKRTTADAYGVGLQVDLSHLFRVSNTVVNDTHECLHEAFGEEPVLPKGSALCVLPEASECETEWMHDIRKIITQEPGSFTEAGHPVPFESVMVRTAVRPAPAATQ